MRRPVGIVFALFVSGAAAGAGAQTLTGTGNVFINLNAGYQPGSQTFTDSIPLSLYDEAGRIDSFYRVDRSSDIWDVSGGVRVWRNVAAGVGFSRLASRHSADLNALVPHPLFFSRFRHADTKATDLKHTEIGVHLQAIWMMPVTERVEVALAAGPSFFTVRQDIAVGVPVSEVGFPFEEVALGAVTTATRSKTAVGVNIGTDATVMITPMVGAGLFMRYAGASAGVDLTGSRVSLKSGGFQTGLGVRLRF